MRKEKFLVERVTEMSTFALGCEFGEREERKGVKPLLLSLLIKFSPQRRNPEKEVPVFDFFAFRRLDAGCKKA